jgi:hypothetical protein
VLGHDDYYSFADAGFLNESTSISPAV